MIKRERKPCVFSHHRSSPFGSGMFRPWHAAWSKPRLTVWDLRHWRIEARAVILAIAFDSAAINSWPAKLTRWYVAVGCHHRPLSVRDSDSNTHTHTLHVSEKSWQRIISSCVGLCRCQWNNKVTRFASCTNANLQFRRAGTLSHGGGRHLQARARTAPRYRR